MCRLLGRFLYHRRNAEERAVSCKHTREGEVTHTALSMTTMSVPMWRPWPWDICVCCRDVRSSLCGLGWSSCVRVDWRGGWLRPRELSIEISDTSVSATGLDAHHSLIIYNVNYAPTSAASPESPALPTLNYPASVYLQCPPPRFASNWSANKLYSPRAYNSCSPISSMGVDRWPRQNSSVGGPSERWNLPKHDKVYNQLHTSNSH